MKKLTMCIVSVLALVIASASQAGNVTGLTTFVADTPARAADVNNNFTQVKSAVDDNDGRITTNSSKIDALQASIQQLQNDLAAAQSDISTLQSTIASQNTTISNLQNNLSNVVSLNQYLTVSSDSRGPLVQFSGVNVQVVNGMGATNTVNGLGNLIIGYDEADTSGDQHCTVGYYSGNAVLDSITCNNAGGTWTTTGFKSGSHNLVVGQENNYSSFGAAIIGYRNSSVADNASVLGGADNTASAPSSSISGGYYNWTRNVDSSVSGGYNNVANGISSSVSGGQGNYSEGLGSSVSGGSQNNVYADYGSISAGSYNNVDGKYGGVSGGNNNTASGLNASILGGQTQSAGTDYQTIPALP